MLHEVQSLNYLFIPIGRRQLRRPLSSITIKGGTKSTPLFSPAYLKLGRGGTRLSRVFQTPFSPAVVFSSSWGRRDIWSLQWVLGLPEGLHPSGCAQNSTKGRCLNQKPKPQWLYSKLLSDVWAPHRIFKAKPSPPNEETNWGLGNKSQPLVLQVLAHFLSVRLSQLSLLSLSMAGVWMWVTWTVFTSSQNKHHLSRLRLAHLCLIFTYIFNFSSTLCSSPDHWAATPFSISLSFCQALTLHFELPVVKITCFGLEESYTWASEEESRFIHSWLNFHWSKCLPLFLIKNLLNF